MPAARVPLSGMLSGCSSGTHNPPPRVLSPLGYLGAFPRRRKFRLEQNSSERRCGHTTACERHRAQPPGHGTGRAQGTGSGSVGHRCTPVGRNPAPQAPALALHLSRANWCSPGSCPSRDRPQSGQTVPTGTASAIPGGAPGCLAPILSPHSVCWGWSRLPPLPVVPAGCSIMPPREISASRPNFPPAQAASLCSRVLWRAAQPLLSHLSMGPVLCKCQRSRGWLRRSRDPGWDEAVRVPRWSHRCHGCSTGPRRPPAFWGDA